MSWNLVFFVNSILLGMGLAMDAFSVSLANGLNDPHMSAKRTCIIAAVFGGFQAFMPMLGWFFVHSMLTYFQIMEKFIPWIALILLLFIGGKMLIEGIKAKQEEHKQTKLGVKTLIVQGVATSIDALSVGFTIADYNVLMAIVSASIIAVVTFIICIAGLLIGKRFGMKLSNKAQILGGVILIGIGLEIFISSFL